jgi:hypothetical protein
MATHESFVPRDTTVMGSDRSFGLVFAAVFAVIGLLPLVLHGTSPLWWALGLCAAFALLALLRPAWLRPLNRVWFRFGLLLHKVTSPLVLGLLFYVTVVPIGLLMRALGKRPIPTGFAPDAESYWIRRDPPGPTGESMKNQF